MFVCSTCGRRYERAGYCATDGQPLVQTNDSLLGTEIDRYRLAKLIGEGGMGRVYQAVQPAIGSRVAIKILSEECTKTPELLERFFAEARAVNLIRHENIVGVIDMAVLPDGRPFIVMEYIDGQTLADIVRAQQAPIGGVIQVMGEVLGALAAAHAIGIVHRDLKPDNIIVTVEGHAKVLDFGIAKLSPGLRDLGPQTKTGAILGTPAYMAPEQISGAGNVDARTDVYACGVVLFEAVTGRQPFSGATLFDLMKAHVEQQPPLPRLFRPDLPDAIEQVIMVALAKDPAQRFQSATAMAQALAHAASALAQEQWKPLSSRGGVHTPRISAQGGVQPTPKLTPQQSPHPIPMEAYRSTAVAPGGRTEARLRKTGRIVAIAVAAMLALGIGLFAIAKHGDDDKLVAAAGSAAAPAPGASDAAALVRDDPAPPVHAEQPPPAGQTNPGQPNPGQPNPGQPNPGQPNPGQTGQPNPGQPNPGQPNPGQPNPGQPNPGRPGPGQTNSGRPGPGQTNSGRPDPGHGATIINGGSAADHGVIIGDNVHIGPNVVIGSQTPAPSPDGPAKSVTRAADYDAKHFDPVAFLPKAEALAKQLAPDAHLTSFEFDPVFPDGHVDLTMDGRDHEYDFRSVARSARPSGVPRNVPVDRPCMIHVEISATKAVATVRTNDACDAKLVHAPKCRFASVWKQAIAKGTATDIVARVAWLSDEQWFFDIDLEGKGGGVSTFPDRCP
jgi:serine/threonine-protein kinase